MRGGDLTYWLAWLLGPVLICLGVVLTWWGLFGDRARGRRRCPRCWHDLSHTPGMTCSECGYTAKQERTFIRTRRRLLPTVVGVVMASVAATWGIELLQRQGVISQLPTRVLIPRCCVAIANMVSPFSYSYRTAKWSKMLPN